ncbi:MAG: acetyl-CoA carboxylase biotin carboxyl carrier protein subunit [Cenarchaeum symbiont of Oopsacas minuta]|nr:acetyl-CoA carboxylase biotin carboxyl carrier protein subunit [Cenarchaeum symbiont of Oopsacas minuta]
MEYRIKDIEKAFNCTIIGHTSDGGYEIDIDGKKSNLQILSTTSHGMEFVLDGEYHSVKYLVASTSTMDMIVDGVPISLDMHTTLDEIVFKNSGGAGKAVSDILLFSKIPGKIITVTVSVGDTVNVDDTICTLESMKMQISVKAHRAGTIKSLKTEIGASIAKGDLIAEIE